MLGFYLDSALTRLVSQETPKQLLVSTSGGTKTTSVWLGDPTAGTTYTFDTNVAVQPVGSVPGLQVSVKRSMDEAFGFPGTPLLLADLTLLSGVTHAVRVDLQMTIAAGSPAIVEFWGLETNGYRVSTDAGTVPRSVTSGPCRVIRADQTLAQHLRVLPIEREVATALPGFRIGEHRWRDQDGINAAALVPSRWDASPEAIGLEKFIAGIGANDDLKPVQVEEVEDSLYLRISRGHYFTGHRGYFLPAQPVLECLPGHEAEHVLAEKPRPTCPIFVGTYRLDSQGFYEKDREYRHLTALPAPSEDAPEYDWYHFDPTTRLLTVNNLLESQTVFLGTLSEDDIDYFDIPAYPVVGVRRVYLERGAGNAPLECPTATSTFNRTDGTIRVRKPEGGLVGEPVYADVDPGFAVLYETGTQDSCQVPVDVNPAFAGISSGYVYLQHRRQKPASITLTCDKPLIAIPATHESIIGLVAYGPVYFDGDYALLTATAYSQVSNEPVPNARLRVVVDAENFAGLLNYRDPLQDTIEVVTGGDGTANLIYVPTSNAGVYLPAAPAAGSDGGVTTTTATNDSLVLPVGVPISQIRNDAEGWLVTAYAVYNNHPLFGKVGGSALSGEVVWQTSGTPGHANYRTNGLRDAFRTGQTVVYPVRALDADGANYDEPEFSGLVKTLVFEHVVPSGPTVGAYYVTYVQRHTLQLHAVDANVLSNTILLDVVVPTTTIEHPWLALNDGTQGVLGTFRLGWQPRVSPTL